MSIETKKNENTPATLAKNTTYIEEEVVVVKQN